MRLFAETQNGETSWKGRELEEGRRVEIRPWGTCNRWFWWIALRMFSAAIGASESSSCGRPGSMTGSLPGTPWRWPTPPNRWPGSPGALPGVMKGTASNALPWAMSQARHVWVWK